MHVEIEGIDAEMALEQGALDRSTRRQLAAIARAWDMSEAASLERILDDAGEYDSIVLEDQIALTYSRLVDGVLLALRLPAYPARS